MFLKLLKICPKNKLDLSKIIGIIFAIYMIFYNLNQDVFTRYQDVITLPWTTIFSLNMDKAVPYSEIFSDKKITYHKKTSDTKISTVESTEQGYIYIYVLDISKSFFKNEYINKPKWYDEAVNELIEKLELPENIALKSKGRRIKRNNLILLQLYRLLSYLISIPGQENGHTPKFAIWTIGDTGTRIYPSGISDPEHKNLYFLPVSRDEIHHGIQKIQQLLGKKGTSFDDYTDFYSLFNKLWDDYNEYLPQDMPRYKRSPVIITFLSDMLHDIDKEEKKREHIWKQLKSRIIRMTNAKIMANMVSVSDNYEKTNWISILQRPNDEYTDNIYTIFEQQYSFEDRLTLLKKEDYREDIKSRFLFPKIALQKGLIFYYENDTMVNNIDILMDDAKDIIIEMPTEEIGIQYKNISLKWEIRDKDGKDFAYSFVETPHGVTELASHGFIRTELPFKRIIGKNQVLRLKYSENTLNTFERIVPKRIVIRIIDNKECQSYLMPIKFIKKLPDPIAKFMIGIQVLFAILSILLLVGFFAPLMNKKS